MAYSQTNVQNQDNILLESAKIEYSTDGGSTLKNLGLADNVSISFSSTPRDVQPGNGPAPDVVKGSAAQSAEVSADLWELSMTAVEDLTGGLFTKGTVAGTPVAAHAQALAINSQEAGGFQAFDIQSYAGAVPTAISIADTSGAYTLTTDYLVIKVGDLWGVQWVAGGSFDPTKIITITFTTTPSAEENVTVGGTSTQTPVYLKVTQIVARNDVAYDIHNIWELYKGFQSGDLVMALKNKDETDPVGRIPLTIGCELDGTRAAGDQLMKMRRVQVAH